MAVEQLQAARRVRMNVGWIALTLAVIIAAAAAGYLVGRDTVFSVAHRAAAAGAALLVIVALGALAQIIVVSYQSSAASQVPLRRRGLKAAIIGADGRASTSLTGVVLWTTAVVWALTYLLLVARSYPGGTLFTNALSHNWRPEYLVLLGLPVAAATTAKAAVSTSNAGNGPVSSAAAPAVQQALGLRRVYIRDTGTATGFLTGIAELVTDDTGAVAWADLQYVVFTLFAVCYFGCELLSRPQDGLPPMPAVLLTMMGVSATAYVANKLVSTQGVDANPAPAGQPNGG